MRKVNGAIYLIIIQEMVLWEQSMKEKLKLVLEHFTHGITNLIIWHFQHRLLKQQSQYWFLGQSKLRRRIFKKLFILKVFAFRLLPIYLIPVLPFSSYLWLGFLLSLITAVVSLGFVTMTWGKLERGSRENLSYFKNSLWIMYSIYLWQSAKIM